MLTMLLGPLVHLSFASFPTAPWLLSSPRGSALGAATSPAGELLASAGAFSVLGKGCKGGPGAQRIEKRATLSGAGASESLPGPNPGLSPSLWLQHWGVRVEALGLLPGCALPQCLLELRPALLDVSVLGGDSGCQAGLQAEELGHSHIQHLEEREQPGSDDRAGEGRATVAMVQVRDGNPPPALRGQERWRVPSPVPCCLWEGSPIHHTAPATPHGCGVPTEPPALLVASTDPGRHTSPLCQDAPQGSEDEAEPCTYHHLAGYVPDIPIPAWLALPWLPYTADAPLL